MTTTTRLMRDLQNRMLGGVCAGIARRYGWDATLVRVAFVLAGVFSAGTAVVLYVAAWVIMPAGSDVEAGGSPALKEEFRDAGDRAAESARILARAAKQAAAEIADVARRPLPGAAPAAAPPTAAPETPSATVASTEGTPAAEPEAPTAAEEEQREQQPPAASL